MYRLVMGGLWLGLLLLVFANAVSKPLNHDEHQFVASGWLIGRLGLLPYRDFPYFHLPYLSWLYAGIFLFTDHLLLGARLISALAATGSAWLIWRLARGQHHTSDTAISSFATAWLWLLLPISQYASGFAWNHDTSIFWSLCALTVFIRAESGRAYGFSGLCLAIACGLRATFVLTLLPFVLALGLAATRRAHWRFFALGFTVGWLPILLLSLFAPTQFFFGNVTYAVLNTEWRAAQDYARAMDWGSKLSYFMTDVAWIGPTWVVLMVFGLSVIITWRRQGAQPFWLSAGMACALFIAALLPTPSFLQYFFAPIPFLVLCIGWAAPAWLGKRYGAWLMPLLVALFLPQLWGSVERTAVLLTPAQWTPVQAHQAGVWIRERTGDGAIVTLAPLFPLEAGLSIYPELATGPFAYRVGGLLSPDERRVQRIFTIDDIETVLNARPPRALFLGFEDEDLEEPLAQYAQARKYRYHQLPNGKHLWVRP
jgi:hypothetical protein